MYGYIGFLIALLGSSVAAWWDLRTTEVPDYVSVTTAAAGLLFNAGLWIYTGEPFYIISSLVVGTVFFAVGWIFFMTGVWGGADALVMGAAGYALPYLPEAFSPLFVAEWPFAFTLLFNIFIVGTIYTLGFAVYQGLKSEKVMSEFLKDMKDYWKRIVWIFVLYSGVLLGVSHFYGSGVSEGVQYIQLTAPLLVGMLMVYRYLRIVEDHGMREEIPVEELSEGDVLAEDVETEEGTIDSGKIVGITGEQVERIKEVSERVSIKYGVMFVPAFPVAILLSVTVGDIIYMLLV